MSIIADQKTVEERRAICAACPFRQGKVLPRCKQCGCLIMGKTKLAASSCPLKKW